MTINQEEKLERVVFEKVLYGTRKKMKYDGLQDFLYTHSFSFHFDDMV